MSGQETPKSDHKEQSVGPPFSPPTKSTTHNIFKNFPTSSAGSVRGSQHAHDGQEAIAGISEKRISRESMETLGLLGDKHESERTSFIPITGGRVAERTAAIFQDNTDRYLMLSKEGLDGEGWSKGGAAISSNTEISNQGETKEGKIETIQHNFDTYLKLSSHSVERGDDDDGYVAGHQLNSDDVGQITVSSDNAREEVKVKNSEDSFAEPVTHSFCFHLSEPQKNEAQPDSSCESHPLTTSSSAPGPKETTKLLASAASKSRIKPSKKQKGLGSPKDCRDSDSSVSSRKGKKSFKSKTRIKSKFAPGSLEYIEECLRGRIFSGWVEERQWVECVGAYRDVIEVDEWEDEMNQQLQVIISSIPGVQDGTRWINITPPDNKTPSYCLWALLESPPTPGHYWFTVTGTKLQPHFGLMISVKQIRKIHPHDGELSSARQRRLKKNSENSPQSELETIGEMLHNWLHKITNLRLAVLLSFITSTFTLSNIKETVRFLTVLLMTLVIGLVTFIRESHVIGLRFVREAGIFLHNATPFLQTLLGFFEKIIGGIFLLVAMVYRDIRRPNVPPPGLSPPPPLPLTPSPPRPTTGPRAIQYVSPERWVVRTQNNDFT